MLTKNIWQAKGLYNGALGTVRGILYGDGIAPPNLPRCVLVEFDEYQGPRIDPVHNVVPIVTEIVQFDARTGKPEASREQLPLVLGWAITIHKSQGLTLKFQPSHSEYWRWHRISCRNLICRVFSSEVIQRACFQSQFPMAKDGKLKQVSAIAKYQNRVGTLGCICSA